MSDELPPGSRPAPSPGHPGPASSPSQVKPDPEAVRTAGADPAPHPKAGASKQAESQVSPFPATLPGAAEPESPSWAAQTLDGPPLPAGGLDAEVNLVGTVIADRYEVQQKVGQGSMGAVYVARHKTLGSRFAVKVMLSCQDAEESRRFLSEARLASRVHHPNTVYIADFGTLPSGRLYLVMEFLDGSTLAAIIAQGPLLPARACAIGAQIAHGLWAVHNKGIIHRDLHRLSSPSRKPAPAGRWKRYGTNHRPPGRKARLT